MWCVYVSGLQSDSQVLDLLGRLHGYLSQLLTLIGEYS